MPTKEAFCLRLHVSLIFLLDFPGTLHNEKECMRDSGHVCKKDYVTFDFLEALVRCKVYSVV